MVLGALGLRSVAQGWMAWKAGAVLPGISMQVCGMNEFVLVLESAELERAGGVALVPG